MLELTVDGVEASSGLGNGAVSRPTLSKYPNRVVEEGGNRIAPISARVPGTPGNGVERMRPPSSSAS